MEKPCGFRWEDAAMRMGLCCTRLAGHQGDHAVWDQLGAVVASYPEESYPLAAGR